MKRKPINRDDMPGDPDEAFWWARHRMWEMIAPVCEHPSAEKLLYRLSKELLIRRNLIRECRPMLERK